MTPKHFNPYEVSTNAISSDTRTGTDDRVVRFSGEITRDDYIALMPDRWFYYAGLLLQVLSSMVCLLGLICFLIALRDSFQFMVLGVVTILLGACMICSAVWATSRSRKCEQAIRQFPNLLIPVEGYMAEDGVVFESTTCRQWVSWCIIRQSSVSSAGVRLQFPESPYRFYAIAMRMMNGLDHREFAPVLARWKKCSLAAMDEIESIASNRLSPKLDSSIWFRCSHQVRDQASRRKVYWTIVGESVIGLGACVAYFLRPEMSWLFIFLFLMAIWSICVRVHWLIRSMDATNLQWGWVGTDRCVMGWNQSGFEAQTEGFQREFVDDERLTVSHDAGAQWTIFRSTLVEPHRWNELLDLFPSRRSGE